jgi:hypothetical protein
MSEWAALALLVVTSRNSGRGLVLSDECVYHPETSSGSRRLVRKKWVDQFFFIQHGLIAGLLIHHDCQSASTTQQ